MFFMPLTNINPSHRLLQLLRTTFKSPKHHVTNFATPAYYTITSLLSTSAMSSTVNRPTVFVTRPDIPQPALQLLKQSCDVKSWTEASPCPRDFLLKHVKGIDGLFCTVQDRIDDEVLRQAGPSLKVVGTMSVGYDHVNMPALRERGVKLGFTPDVLTDATAELSVALLLATSRRILESNKALINGDWLKSGWGPTWMMGMGLAQSTVGIYGLGRIGQGVWRRLEPFGVKEFLYSGRGKRTDVEGARYVQFDDLCALSDFIIVTAALSAETKEIFNARAFNLMKPNCIFINSSRGGLVQQEDLVEALQNKKIFGAGLDVMTPEPLPLDHPLTTLNNCAIRKWADTGGQQYQHILYPAHSSSSLFLCLFVWTLIFATRFAKTQLPTSLLELGLLQTGDQPSTISGNHSNRAAA